MLCTSVLDFVRVEASQGAQLLELVCRSYSEFGQVMTLAEEQAVLEIAAGEPLAKAWLIRCQGELIGYFILALTFSLRCRGRGAVLDQIYLTPELRTQRVLCRVIEFVEYQAALVGATMLDVKFTFKDKREPVAFERIGFEKGHSFMSKHEPPLILRTRKLKVKREKP